MSACHVYPSPARVFFYFSFFLFFSVLSSLFLNRSVGMVVVTCCRLYWEQQSENSITQVHLWIDLLLMFGWWCIFNAFGYQRSALGFNKGFCVLSITKSTF